MILKQQKIFRLIAIICYLLIILNGEMIGLPFFLWLLFTFFDFGNIDQLFAFFALIGMTINFINTNKERIAKILLLDIFCFLLLASPIVGRLTAVPIGLFNYYAFVVPIGLFVLFYFISLCFGFRQYLQISKSVKIVE